MTAAPKIPLATVADTVDARGRAARKFPGNMRPETVDAIEMHCHIGAATLRIVDQYADGLRHLIEFLRARQTDERRRLLSPPTPEETTALLAHPAVRGVIAAFPDAVLAGVGAIPPIPHTTTDEAAS